MNKVCGFLDELGGKLFVMHVLFTTVRDFQLYCYNTSITTPTCNTTPNRRSKREREREREREHATPLHFLKPIRLTFLLHPRCRMCPRSGLLENRRVL
jgi:hypothetical protein